MGRRDTKRAKKEESFRKTPFLERLLSLSLPILVMSQTGHKL